MRVEVVLAWPERCLRRELVLPEGSTVADAVAAAALDATAESVAMAVHGVLARPQQVLHDGDRVELLRPLLADPKENRRRRARGGD
ncbi:MAG: RnfH family protein [Lysobacteraceae bacterium SCN 69-123]|jgi:putative ubiquitin-RnfH superfamily antitoxin RatB of RatAB toxin-antitoxin module|uniref:RnfH family protein n=1 Tax=Stenotrophomonas acidaminiphila TaxID=128780 RepID=UPI00086D6E32|nr:RnfH family protein [Stenotrophomonas acidaminiphila]MBN8803076.1 RnfH family protein [Stenotrophomonas acidaminiphila]MDF9442991.1 RnfH family protein [Stenotrophomonas acidaminiphila]ODU46110.1 MAG: RnfH family protein [Xanthomonadaceae bacterium SCN 69-123]OJY73819.1 MAG: RnfH family protein [Stenotrophomonas sp. 69-14]